MAERRVAELNTEMDRLREAVIQSERRVGPQLTDSAIQASLSAAESHPG